jgi:hypothetical protein
MIAVDENLCGIRLPALRRDIVCDVSTVRLVLAALGADLYAGSQYGVSTNNLSQLAPRLRNDVLGTRATVVTGDALGQRFRTNIQANHFLHRPLPSWEWPNAGSRCEPQGRAPSAQFVTKI